MATTNYYSIHGQIIGEKTAGSSRVDYLTDALGSVTATVDQSANVINTYRYKPYGGLLAKTGAGSDPAFLWVGTQGYRNTGKVFSDVYVRARHYSSALGGWGTKDRLLPESIILNRSIEFSEYLYGRANPTNMIDRSGERPCPDGHGDCYGEIPPGVSCKQIESFADGVTRCYYQKQSIYTLVCATTCIKKCIYVHEKVHGHDLARCCSTARRCIKRNSLMACHKAWYRWHDKIGHWGECRAYHEDLPCFQNLYDWACKQQKGSCCGIVKPYLDDSTQRLKHCKGIDFSPNAKPEPPCAWDKYGKIVV